MRYCGLCGAQLSAVAGNCPRCGAAYSEGGLPSDLLMACPEWGAIKFDLNHVENRAAMLLLVERAWTDLESRTSQALFAGQLSRDPTNSGSFTLYGPKESFERLVDVLGALAGQCGISFQPMEYDEILRIRSEQQGVKLPGFGTGRDWSP